MLKQVITIFAPPVFPEDEDKTRKAKYANAIAFAFLAVIILYEIVLRIFGGFAEQLLFDLILFGFSIVCITGLLLLRQGHVQFTSVLLVVLLWVASNSIAVSSFGARDSSYIMNFAIVLMAGLLLGWQASLVVTLLTIFSGFALAYAEQNGLIRIGSYPIILFARDITFVLILNGVFMYLLINGLENALKRSRMSLKQLESANANLNYTQNELQDRTAQLVVSNKQLENRTQKLHAIAMVTRAVASIQDFDLLLASITGAISKELGYYHVGLFLLDEQREFAILRSANSAGGLKMLNSGYRVPVRQIDSVGFVVQTGQPRIVLLTDEDLAVLHNPTLPESRSEIMLPLKSGNQVLGVLDIQSAEASGIIEDDISTLSILADQVGITIQNSLLYEQSQNALRRADLASIQTSTQAWKEYEKSIQTRGYRYDGIKSEALKDVRPSNKGSSSLLIPIQLRGQTIGRFKLNPSDPLRHWTDDELIMVRATAERVALALEGTRLLDEAQKRATREAFLSNVSTKLSASFQLDSILRDTVQELGETLKNSTITFQLMNPAELNISKAKQDDGTPAHKQELGAGDD